MFSIGDKLKINTLFILKGHHMNMKSVLPLFAILFVGLMNADETSATNIELIKDNSKQLLILQENSKKKDSIKELMMEMQLCAFLQGRFVLEYNRCESGISCDQLSTALFDYKESIIKVQRLAEESQQTDEYKQLREFLRKL